MSRSAIQYAILGTLLVSISGCGGKELAGVHGKVTHGGSSVTSGALVFSPLAKEEEQRPGKSATGDIQPDGTFQLSTHRLHDGAVVGRHRVRFIPAIDDQDKQAGSKRGRSVDFTRLTLPADYEVEIQSGRDNEFEIQLVERQPK